MKKVWLYHRFLHDTLLTLLKAYLLGQNDDAYKDIVQSISAVLFLATPHRGTNLAEVLNKILSACAMVTSPKLYVDELNRNSKTLEDLNEQFKNIAPKLHLVSFYETQKTSIGIRKMVGICFPDKNKLRIEA